MKRLVLLFALCIAVICSPFLSYSQTDVLTQHNDLERTGWNKTETQLTTSNVNTSTFGLLFTRSVDDNPYAQPLIVSGVNIPGVGARNVLYVCTVNNTVYAFDADDGSVAAYWQRNYNPTGYRAAKKTEMHPSLCGGSYADFAQNIGIVGTPVIDKSTNTMYFVTKVVDNTAGVVDNHAWNNDEYSYTTDGFYQYLHAVDISTGAEKFNGPMKITATAPGTGDGSVNGSITFDARRQFDRCGLVLSRGIVYITYAAHCDWNPSHGWVMGYDAATLQQKMVYMTTPNDGRGGIWMSGAAPAVDATDGSLFFTSGNAYDGTKYSNSPADLVNRGESVVKLTPNKPDNTATALTITSYFTPYNYQHLNDFDADFPIQTLLIPNTNLLLTGCKDAALYLMNKDNLGGFNTTTNNVLQRLGIGTNGLMHSSFAYYGGATNKLVYQFAENTLLQAFKVNTSSLTLSASSNISGPSGSSGAYMSVSSNGTDNNSAILWITHALNGCNANQAICAGVLRAVRADNVNIELWNSSLNPADNMGNFGKMSPPTIANGKVYVTSFSNQIAVYGNKPNTGCTNPNIALIANNSLATYSASSTATGSNVASAFDNDTTTAWTANASGTGGGNGATLTVNLGASFTVCKVAIHWGVNYAKAFNVQGSTDGTNFTTISTITGNISKDNVIPISNVNYQYIRLQGVTRLDNTAGYIVKELEVDGQATNTCAAPTGLTATNITENTAKLNWQGIPDATSYTIQYKTSLVSSWITRTTTATTINISALTCGTGYTFKVNAVCASGKGAETSATFTTSACTNNCGILPARWLSADIGDIGITGSSCLSGGIYTIKGSGNRIGGTSDQFQYAFTSFAGDFNIQTQIITQDAVAAGNKAGIMFRDSVSNTSRFVFVGTTNANGIVFEYRTTPGGATTQVTITNIKAPYWVELVKSGTQYTAYISPSGGANTWTQIGTTINGGFGNSATYAGMAVASTDNSQLSTATFRNFAVLEAPLLVKLVDFSATNMNNQYVHLKWSTSSEIDSKYFEVQRSADGLDFVSINQVTSAGNSNTLQNYSADDYQATNGLNYYRLAEISADGTISYSSVVKVLFGTRNTPQIFPNPAGPYVTITSGAEMIKDVSIFDAAGKNVERILNNNGQSVIRINTAQLAAGVYMIKITTASQTFEQKLFKK
ncbi:MAG: discoidin domain-containing protein [Chitinophagaceae bacterium]